MKRELVIIDAQNDFCDPNGALYVEGAEEDCRRMARFLERKGGGLAGITLTLDSHHLYDISHPLYWVDSSGNHPVPFTLISVEDVETRRWKTTRPEEEEWGLEYVRTLKKKGKYTLCIWPPHCLIGSWGALVQEELFRAILDWEEKKLISSHKILKGDDYRTEHYGAFEAEVNSPKEGASLWLDGMIEKMKEADEIYIAGEALDFCVANTVRQLAERLPSDQTGKIVLLRDCCSSVNPESGMSQAFLEEIEKKGMRIALSTEI